MNQNVNGKKKKPEIKNGIVGPPWAPKKAQPAAVKGKDLLEEKIANIEKNIGRKLSDSEKDNLGITIAFVSRKK